MSKFIVLPNGNAISMQVVASITLYPGKGVSCKDDQRRSVAWIEVEDPEKGARVRETLIRCARTGVQGFDPDWSFLTD